MNKEVLREIKTAREEAISELLHDVGFWEAPKAKENAEQKEKGKNHAEKGTGIIKSTASIVNKIVHYNQKKEEEFYKARIEEILSKKENLIKNI